MVIDTSTTSLRDITLLFDDVVPSKIDISKLRELFDIQPTAIQTPDLSVIIYPPLQFIIQIGQKRIRMTHQQPSQKIDAIPLWDIAHTCRKLVSNQSLVAYGLNYDVLIPATPREMESLIKTRFISNLDQMNTLLNGEIVTFAPRINFKRNGVLYDFILEEQGPATIKAHLNAHFDTKQLPSRSALKNKFVSEYEEFRKMLKRVFSQE